MKSASAAAVQSLESPRATGGPQAQEILRHGAQERDGRSAGSGSWRGCLNSKDPGS